MEEIRENPIIREAEETDHCNDLFERFGNKKNFIHSIIKYPSEEEQESYTDIFQYITRINQLRDNDQLFFIFNASMEGYFPYHWFDILYTNAKEYNIDPFKVIFVSSNLNDNINIKNYNYKHNIKNSINVFCTNFFKITSKNYIDFHSYNEKDEKALKQFRKDCFKNHQKIFLSLSRRSRNHRVMSQYLLHTSDISNECLMSQDTIDNDHIVTIAQEYDLNIKDLKKWSNTYLPLTADTDDFEPNYALSGNDHLFQRTLFEIINETDVDNQNQTCLFFSEKTFRAMAKFQPFIIFGQPGCNHELEKMGFKLYRNMFDYSFDFETDTKKRYIKLLKTIEPIVYNLRTMNTKDRIKWKFQNSEDLLHNYKKIKDNTEEDKELRLFLKRVLNQKRKK